jgi:murein DD-endopeptidase MepM/ murein hydrolase activator NlpD
MREKKRSKVLLVPPGGEQIRTVHLHGGLLLFLVLVIAGGFAGYFIPFNSFSIDVVEQNRQKNLETQNKKLLSAIRPMRKLLDNLGNEVQKFEGKRKDLEERLGMKEAVRPRLRQKNHGDLEGLLSHVNNENAFFQGFYAIISRHPAIFDSLPLIKPLPDNPDAGARFGPAKDPFTRTMKDHCGEDFIAQRGTPVVASASGIVTRAEENRVWGKRVMISHGFGFSTVYAHLGTIEAFGGKRVAKGDCIGTVGISGMTSGPHVHYEVWYRGKAVDPEDLFFPSVDSVMNTALR